MKVEAFNYHLPSERIAHEPASPRDAARMLVVHPDGLADRNVRDLPDYLKPGDVLVVNDTRVIPARLYGMRGDVRIEILLHKAVGEGKWEVFARPAKRLKAGQQVLFMDGFTATVLDKTEDGFVLLDFGMTDGELYRALEACGQMPLPPYIERQQAQVSDQQNYQTVFAAKEGAVAAPTAGLHFTAGLLDTIRAKGVTIETVTLHVGAGTFLPVKAEDTEGHVMHAEYAELDAATAERLNTARRAGGRIVAVGTTSLRTLESAADEAGVLHPFAAETRLFITPGYIFRAVDLLLTNFHLPKSTLFMLVSAFSGLERMKFAYQHAIEREYRFYSYGDACLLYPPAS